MALQFSNNNNNVIQGKSRKADSFVKSFMQQSGNQNSSDSTSSFEKFSTLGMNSGDNTSSSGGNTQNPSSGSGMRTADMQDSDGDRIDDRDQGGPGDPILGTSPSFTGDFSNGGGSWAAPNQSLGEDTSTNLKKYALIKEKAEQYKSYMGSKDGTKGWGSQDKVGNSQKIGPTELAAMREESGFSKNEIDDFFNSEEGRGYLSNKSQNQFDASQVTGESPQSPTQPLGGDTEAPTDKFANAREAADKYKTYMDDGSGTGWGSSEFKGDNNYIGPNELAAMRRDSGLSDTELNDFFQTGEGQQYFHRKHRTGGTGSKNFNNLTSELANSAQSAQSAQEYKDNYVDSKFYAPTDIDKTDNSSVNSNNTTNDNSMNDSNNREDYDKQNDNQGVIGDGTQANNNSGLVGDGTKMDDNTGNIGDFNAQDSYNTDINSTTGESGQGGINNTNIKSPFEVSGDLTNDIGNQSQNDYNFSNSTVGDFAKIGNDYSVTIGNIGNGNNMGSDSGQGSNAPMNNMQAAAAYGALNTNAQQKSSDQLSGLERGVIGAGLASSLTNSNEFAANAYNNAAAAAQNFRDKAAVAEDKLYGNTDFDLSGWNPLRSPKKPEDKTQEIAGSFN